MNFQEESILEGPFWHLPVDGSDQGFDTLVGVADPLDALFLKKLELGQFIHAFLETLSPVILEFPDFFAPVELGKIGNGPGKTVMIAFLACVFKRDTQVRGQGRFRGEHSACPKSHTAQDEQSSHHVFCKSDL